MKIAPVSIHSALRAVAFAAACAGIVGVAGCAGLEADVKASGVGGAASNGPAANVPAANAAAVNVPAANAPAAVPRTRALPGAQTYRLARTPSQASTPGHAAYEMQLRDALAAYGFTDVESDQAHYVLSIAYDTRPATVSVQTGDCAADGPACSAAMSPGFAWFGRRAYRHTLTLRFFDGASGAEIYKVSAAIDDHDTDPAHASPWLIKSALAKFPFDSEGRWRIKLRADSTTNTPAVTAVVPKSPE